MAMIYEGSAHELVHKHVEAYHKALKKYNDRQRHINAYWKYWRWRDQAPSIVLQRRLNEARLNERVERFRKKRRRRYIDNINNSAPLVQNSLVLKYCIVIVLIMTLITFNLTGEITIETQIDNPPYELQEISYTDEYKNSFYDEKTAFDKLTKMGEAMTIFGQNTTWSDIINSFANKDVEGTNIFQITKTIALIMFFPINEVINIGTLFINLVNSWSGRQLVNPISFKFANPLDIAPINVIYLPNLFN